MHTVRNRKAAMPRLPDTRNTHVVFPDKNHTTREELGFMLRAGVPRPAAFPSDLIIPPHRGAVITTVASPDGGKRPAGKQAAGVQSVRTQGGAAQGGAAQGGEAVVSAAFPSDALTSLLVDTPASTDQRPLGRKAARKAARRAAAKARVAAVAVTATPVDAEQPPESATVELQAKAVVAPDMAESAPAMTVEMTTLADRAVEGITAPPEPQPAALPDSAPEPAPQAASAPLSPGNPVLPFAPRPISPATAPSPGQMAPLPRNMALAPRRKGLVDTIAFVLLDSGKRLARWSSLRRRAEEDREKLRKAEARMRAMEAQLAALQALQERVRQAGG